MKNIIFTGGVFLFAVIILLCLTSFAVLAYTNAENDLMLAEKNEEYVKAYYKADMRAVEIISKTDEILAESRIGSKNNEEYFKSINNRINESEEHIEIENNILKFRIPVNEKQRMSIEIEILDLKSSKRFRVKSCRLDREEIWEEKDKNESIKGMWKGK